MLNAVTKKLLASENYLIVEVDMQVIFWLLRTWTRNWILAMHRVASSGNASNSVRPRKEKRLTYVLNDADDTKVELNRCVPVNEGLYERYVSITLPPAPNVDSEAIVHCAGINCLAVLKSPEPYGCDYLFTGSRDSTLKRWALAEDGATCSATFESHVDWVNDAVLIDDNTLVSCSSDATVKVWNGLSEGKCARTFRQHSDYVTCLAAAEKKSNFVASGGLGGEVFIWDLEAALAPLSKSNDVVEDDCSTTVNGLSSSLLNTSLRPNSSSNNISVHATQCQGYMPIVAKGHKESVYALATNDRGTLLVSGGTEKVVRVWDPRTGSKTMKLRGHTDNIRALLLDSTGRVGLVHVDVDANAALLYDKHSCMYTVYNHQVPVEATVMKVMGSWPTTIVHSYAVHTDSVWALASTPTFSHVYSGGRDLSILLYIDGQLKHIIRESIPKRWFIFSWKLILFEGEVSLEGSTPVPVYREPSFSIHGTSAIVQHEILNNRRHVLTKDTAGTVKLWEITRGVVIENYGEVSFEKKKEELFEMVSVPAWFTVDTRLGSLSVHLDTPQCFSAEMYSNDLSIAGKPEDDKVNLARETLKGLLAHWLTRRRQRLGSQTSANGEIPTGNVLPTRTLTLSRVEGDGFIENDLTVYPPFEFSEAAPPSIITEGTQGGPWRKKITDLDGSEDEKDFPWWVLDCVLNNRLPPRENTKCSFYLHPCEGSTVQILTQGKLSAPRILRIHKFLFYAVQMPILWISSVEIHIFFGNWTLPAESLTCVVNYVIEKMVLDKPVDIMNGDGTFAPGMPGGQILNPIVGDGSFKCVLPPDMSLATVRAYIWKKPEDLILNYRVVQGRDNVGLMVVKWLVQG
ncbi:hypothetical protein DH2020_037327 [Rehmannia glutinosa]|uniref:WD repeat-containing protein n=1 Tax=Rehmannia glutinosa TaxID=99300 RepID=A0ABR0V2D6_REHGL